MYSGGARRQCGRVCQSTSTIRQRQAEAVLRWKAKSISKVRAKSKPLHSRYHEHLAGHTRTVNEAKTISAAVKKIMRAATCRRARQKRKVNQSPKYSSDTTNTNNFLVPDIPVQKYLERSVHALFAVKMYFLYQCLPHSPVPNSTILLAGRT